MAQMCRTLSMMWERSFIMIVLAVVVLLVTLYSSAVAQGGMLPISDVIDHPVDKDNKDSSSHTREKSEGSYKGQPLSQAKKEMHVKIAKTHFEEPNPVGGGDSKLGKVVRKDKSPDLQDPMKHASDEWLLKFLIEQYQVSDTVEEKVEILQNLENFSHKFENGRDLFKSKSAVKNILIPALNSTHAEIRKAACAVFAVAAQNNGVVQQIAKDAGAIRSLVHLLAFDPQVRTKALFALSSVLRNFPAAQAKFIHEGGIPALMKVAFSFETRKRSLSLVTDFLTERKYCMIELQDKMDHRRRSRSPDIKSAADNIDHYENVEDPCDEFRVLEKALKDSGWCDVLSDSVKAIAGFDKDDQLLTIEAVGSSISFCKDDIVPYSRMLQGLLVSFQDDEDFQEETLTLKLIIETLTSPHAPREEL